MHVGRSLDSFVVGHNAALGAVEDRAEFVNRLEAMKLRCVRSLLVSLVGEAVVKSLGEDRLAVLGAVPFRII